MTQNQDEEIISLSRLIKAFLANHTNCDPFEDEFNAIEFIEKIKLFVKESGHNQKKIQDLGEITVILELNQLYENLMTHIEDLLAKINVAPINLIQKVLALSNFEALLISEETLKNYTKNDENFPREWSEMLDISLKNNYGQDIKVQGAADMNIEICNELIRIINNYFTYDRTKPSLNENKLNSALKECMIYTNLLFILKDAFEYFRYEFSTIERTEDAIKFKNNPNYYFFLRAAGKERFNNHIAEYTMPLTRIQADIKTKESSAVVTNNELLLKINGDKENLHRISSIALQAAYYEHIENIKIKELDNCTIQTILLVLSELQSLFSDLNTSGVTETVIATQSLNLIPVFINKKKLVSHLQKLLNIKESTIIKILSNISASLNEIKDLWKTPLISYTSNYYFNTNSLSHLNTTYITNQIIDRFISKQKHLSAFRRYLSTKLTTTKLNKKNIHVLNKERLFPTSLDHSLIFEMETTYLILEPCVIPYPFNSKEYNQLLEEITFAAFILEDQRKALQEDVSYKSKKKIICAVITNFPSLSGLVVNDSFVLDYFLLSNYFSTGEYRKGLAIAGENHIETRELSSIRYYSDEYKMSENFFSFCLNPEPIYQTMLKYEVEEFRIGLENSVPNIFQDGLRKKPYRDMVWLHIKEIEYFLRQLFYFEKTLEKTPEEKRIIEDKINYLLPLVLNAIALQRSDRYARIEVLEIFKKVGNQGIAYLVYSFHNAIEKISNKSFSKSKEYQHDLIDQKKAEQDLNKVLEDILDKSQVRLAKLNLQHSLEKEELEDVIEFLIILLSTLEQRKYLEEELTHYYLLISIFIALTNNEKKYEKPAYDIILNFTDALNFNFQYQMAKNFSEEVLIYSFENQKTPLLGWLCLYRCFLKQKNVYDAAFYGILFVTCVEMHPDADEDLITHTLYNSMLFFRNYGISEMEDILYNALQKLNLSNYDKQKITLSHFSSLLLNRDQNNVDQISTPLEEYLKDNLEDICSYQDKGALPWLAFLYNFRVLKSNGQIVSNIDFLEDCINRLEKEINSETLEKIKAQFFPIPDISKEVFKEAVIKLFQSADFNYAAHELENLEQLAKNVVLLSLNPLDINSLLLTGFAINDQSLTFPNHSFDGLVSFIKDPDKELIQKIEDYEKYVLSKTQLINGQELIWIFDVYNKVYCLKMNSKCEYEVIYLQDWSLELMEKWLKDISGFSFDDKSGEYFINEQENDYLNFSKELAFAQLPVKLESEEIFLYASFRLSTFPHNLMNITTKDQNHLSDIHAEAIGEAIAKEKRDFISLYKPITNVISLEWFLSNHDNISLSMQDFTIGCWIPILDGDYTLLISYDKLQPLLEDNYGIKIETNVVPEKPFNSTVNIFMAHGGKGIEGFKTIYTRNEEGHAIIKEKGIETILGTGTIAVLFICHSASITTEVFAQKLVSLSHQILALGYKAVIAPSWSLNSLICPIWLNEFLSQLKQGVKLSKSVLVANIKVAAEGYNEYHGFYAPSGWAAMHLYGNPNICFKPDKVTQA